MKHISLPTRIVLTLTGILLIAPNATALALPTAQKPQESPPVQELADTVWTGKVTFVSGPNTGTQESALFTFFANHTLQERATGPLGALTGNGYWIQTADEFSDVFVELIPHTTLEVIVTQHGIISGDTYTAYGHGQVYNTASGIPTPVPNTAGDTVTSAEKSL